MTDAGRDAWPRGGVHRVLGTADGRSRPSSRAAAGTSPWCRPRPRTRALWDGLVAALGLPAWFGRNLDALDEALGDRTAPTALVLGGWSAYARARPERWAGLLDVLRDRADDPDPPWWSCSPTERGSSR